MVPAGNRNQSSHFEGECYHSMGDCDDLSSVAECHLELPPAEALLQAIGRELDCQTLLVMVVAVDEVVVAVPRL